MIRLSAVFVTFTKTIVMETFFLIDEDSILDRCLASSVYNAERIFSAKGWIIGEVISEADYLAEKEQNNLELQSPE